MVTKSTEFPIKNANIPMKKEKEIRYELYKFLKIKKHILIMDEKEFLKQIFL